MDYQHVKVGKFAELGNGEKMHYHERNGGGDPVIFLHGGGQGAGGWTNWKTNLDPLAAAGYRAICTDAIGYGISSKPPEQDYNFEYLVSALERFVDSLGMDKVSFVGNSMGGAMTLRYAQRNPERINKLLIMGSGGLADMDLYLAQPAIVKLKELGAKMAGGINKAALKEFLQFLCHDPAIVDEEMVNERFEVAQQQSSRAFTSIHIPNLMGEMDKISHLPLYVFWGIDDKAAPAYTGMELLKIFPRSRMLTFSRCGHWVQTEYSTEFNKACIDFLNET